MKAFILVAAVALVAPSVQAAPMGPDLVVNGEFAFTNGPGQLTRTITEAPPWRPHYWQLGFVVADQAVPDPHEYIALWDHKNTTDEGIPVSNTWDGLAAHGGDFDALIVNTYQAAISQTIGGLTVGKTYDVVFSYGFSEKHNFHRPTQQSMTVTLGADSWTSPTYALPAYGFSGWFDVTVPFVATAAQETLTFQAWGSPAPGPIYHAFPIPVLSNVHLYADSGSGAAPRPVRVGAVARARVTGIP